MAGTFSLARAFSLDSKLDYCKLREMAFHWFIHFKVVLIINSSALDIRST